MSVFLLFHCIGHHKTYYYLKLLRFLWKFNVYADSQIYFSFPILSFYIVLHVAYMLSRVFLLHKALIKGHILARQSQFLWPLVQYRTEVIFISKLFTYEFIFSITLTLSCVYLIFHFHDNVISILYLFKILSRSVKWPHW